MKFTVAIPTYNRPDDLVKCLDSVRTQTLLPETILVVDDGDLETGFIESQKTKFLSQHVVLHYHKKDHNTEARGSSESRNKIVDLSLNDIIFILDDDLVLDPDFLEKIMRQWKSNAGQDLIGVGGVIKNNRAKKWPEKVYNKLFGLSAPLMWDVNDVGYQVWDDGIQEASPANYFHGGVASYRRNLLATMNGFRSFGPGRSALEDVDFCLRAKQAGYHMWIEPEAKTFHRHSAVSRESSFLTGIKESVNRKKIYFHLGNQDFYHQVWFVWASLGWILRQFLVGNFSKGSGMVCGFFTKHRL